jgi:hypothetical protein
LNTYAYVGGNPVSRYDSKGLTQADIDFALRMIQNTQTDLNFFGISKVGTATPPNGFIGLDNPKGWAGLEYGINVHPMFLGVLDARAARSLLETLLHEILHLNYPNDKSEWSIESEAKIRANPIFEGFNRRRLNLSCFNR